MRNEDIHAFKQKSSTFDWALASLFVGEVLISFFLKTPSLSIPAKFFYLYRPLFDFFIGVDGF